MAAKTRPYRFRNRLFRYDFEKGLVSWIVKASEEEYADNEHWQQKFGRNLWDIDEDGYIEIQAAGLLRANWKDKAVRDDYLEQWCDEIDYESALYSKEFLAEYGIK